MWRRPKLGAAKAWTETTLSCRGQGSRRQTSTVRPTGSRARARRDWTETPAWGPSCWERLDPCRWNRGWWRQDSNEELEEYQTMSKQRETTRPWGPLRRRPTRTIRRWRASMLEATETVIVAVIVGEIVGETETETGTGTGARRGGDPAAGSCPPPPAVT